MDNKFCKITFRKISSKLNLEIRVSKVLTKYFNFLRTHDLGQDSSALMLYGKGRYRQ